MLFSVGVTQLFYLLLVRDNARPTKFNKHACKSKPIFVKRRTLL